MDVRERPIEEVIRNQKSCRIGDMDVEFADIFYKIREGINLTDREKELWDAYRKRGT